MQTYIDLQTQRQLLDALTRRLGYPQLRIEISLLEAPSSLAALPVPHKNSCKAFRTEPGSFAMALHCDIGVFALSYFCEHDCITLLFDAWSDDLRAHVLHARDSGGITFALLGGDEPTFVGGGSAGYWQNVLRRIDEFRAGGGQRSPWGLLGAVSNLELIRLHAQSPAAHLSCTPHKQGPTSIVLMVDRHDIGAASGRI